jgi:hypothetical protein
MSTVLRGDDLGRLFKYTHPRTPGVEWQEVQAVPSVDKQDYRVLAIINGAFFQAFINGRDLERTSWDHHEIAKVLGAPAAAIDKLYRNGIAEGRKQEREEADKRLGAIEESLAKLVAKLMEAPANAT